MVEENKNQNEQILEEDAVQEEVVTEDTKKEKKKKHYDVKNDPEYLKLQAENAKLMDQLLRKQAEFENFRKRVNEERIKERKYALNDFLLEAIETIDIFDQAVSTNTDDEKLKKYLNGFIMINNRLKNILGNYGVTKIECLNKQFDPNFASALESVECEGIESGIVTEVVMTGYMYKDKVLRPAMVKVSK